MPFSFTVQGWSDGRLKVSDPITVSTAYQLAAVHGSDDEIVGILAVYQAGGFDPDTLTHAEETTLAGRDALWDADYAVENDPDTVNTLFAWQYADDSWATVHSYPGTGSPSLGELRALASGMAIGKPAAARVPFSMSYVPAGYHLAEVGVHGWTGESGVLSTNDGAYGGALFAKPAPKATGLSEPWDPRTGGPVEDSFVIFVVPGKTKHKVGVPICNPGFCAMWFGDGKVRIEVVSEGRLTEKETIKVLKGMKTVPVKDDSEWLPVAEALPVS